jgi:hypothetical protein
MARQTSSVKSIPTVQQPSTGSVIEFRWSISAALLEENISSNVPLNNLKSFQENFFLSPAHLTGKCIECI